MPQFRRPVLSYDDLRTEAAAFLAKYHPSGEIPVPIEYIAEQDFGIDIVTVPGLQEALRSDDYGVISFITSDLTEIYIDEWVFKYRENRYRFTIAHELAHAILHRELYANAQFDSIESWEAFINSIPDEDHSWLEWQAYAFAGLVLVPPEPLERITRQHLEHVLNGARYHELPIEKVADTVWDIVMEQVASEFKVSAEVVERRAQKDRLREKLFRH